MEWQWQHYLEFAEGILLFWTSLDTDDSPEIWVERRLEAIRTDGSPPEIKRYLSLVTKMAGVIDGSKVQLLEEIEQDLKELRQEHAPQ